MPAYVCRIRSALLVTPSVPPRSQQSGSRCVSLGTSISCPPQPHGQSSQTFSYLPPCSSSSTNEPALQKVESTWTSLILLIPKLKPLYLYPACCPSPPQMKKPVAQGHWGPILSSCCFLRGRERVFPLPLRVFSSPVIFSKFIRMWLHIVF